MSTSDQPFRIRDAQLPADRQTMCDFILGLQHFEFTVEANRRLDAAVAEDHLGPLLAKIAAHGGRIAIAEDEAGTPCGWAVVHEQQDPVFVLASERRIAYIAELFVVERARGTGMGRALIAACEDWARAQGHTILEIGVLAGNGRAKAVYERAGFTPYSIELRKRLA